MLVVGQWIPLGHVTTGRTHLELAPDSRLSGGQVCACMREREIERAVCVRVWRRNRRIGESSLIPEHGNSDVKDH